MHATMNERTIDVVDLIKDGLLGKIWMIHFNAMFSVASVVASTHNKISLYAGRYGI